MAARRSAGDAEPIGIDAVGLGIGPDEADRSLHVVHTFGDSEFRLAAVNDGENGVAAIECLTEECRINRALEKKPTATDAHHDASAVGIFFRREYIHRQGDAVLAAINDILFARPGRLIGPPGWKKEE